jgi:GDPmannose 4,6-dehydratase
LSPGAETRAHGGASGRRALVLGASGQDGSYLCELLVERGYEVAAVVRGSASGRLPNLDGVRDRIRLVQADLLTDLDRVAREIGELEPHEIYNFASISFGPDAWAKPLETARLGAFAVAGLLEAIRTGAAAARFFQASSAWVFGRPELTPQTERTPYAPVEPYGAAKAYGDYLIRAYRERYGLFACSGILYNHESPRRPSRFVTRKVTRAAAAIKLALERELVLGEIDVVRDWGYAKDFVEAASLILRASRPDDYVVATGEAHTVRELVELAFGVVELDWREYVRFDPELARREDRGADLVGDASAARERLGWAPSISFSDLVRLMVEADLGELSGDRAPSGSRPV